MPKVLVLLAQGCEELEAITIIDLLRRANITVVSAGLDASPIKASRGVTLLADATLDEALKSDDYDMVVLPGGMPGADNLGNDPRVNALLVRMAESGKFVGAICAAPRVLARCGLLDGKKATAYPSFIDGGDFPKITYTSALIERDGKILTGRGPGAALDFALLLVETLTDKTTRDEVESKLLR